AAVVLAVLALFGASAEPLYRTAAEPWPRIAGGAAALFGLVSVIIGLWGVLYASRKEEWLRCRLMTERLRQFHFQSFVLRLPEIEASLRAGPEGALAYQRMRSEWFAEFLQAHEGRLDSRLGRIIDSEGEEDAWLHEPDRLGRPVDVEALDELL